MTNPTHQHAVKLYQPGRDLSGCDPQREPSELWLCPNCNRQHHTDVIDPLTYKCICGWWGTKLSLMLAQMPPTDTPQLNQSVGGSTTMLTKMPPRGY